MKRAISLFFVGLIWFAGGAAADELEEIRTDLEQLRFEQALGAIEAYLADPRLPEEDRVEALVLRAQAHLAYGDLDATEQDYRDLLHMRPAYTPEESLIPPKAMKRFEQVRGELIGTLTLNLTPRDARIRIDDRDVAPTPEGNLLLLAGSRRIQFSRAGFDPWELNVEVEAGNVAPLDVQLIPNARTIVIQSDPAGVVVTMDGGFVGETTVADTPSPGTAGYAELRLENVPLGEHDFEFSKPCYRSALYRDLLTVDLDDTEAKVYEPVHLEPASSELAIRNAPAGAELRVDDRRMGQLPQQQVDLCPGSRTVEIRAGGRIIWRSIEQLPIDDRLTVEIDPRPNVVLVGAESWPGQLAALAERVSTLAELPSPDGVDLTGSAGWSELRLPEDTDLAVAVLAGATRGGGERYVLFSPWLSRAVVLQELELDWGRPDWSTPTLGASLVDSLVGGAARVAAVREDSPAAAAGIAVGDRLLSIAGETVADAASARMIVARLAIGETVPLVIEKLDGQRRETGQPLAASPVLYPPARRAGPAGLLLAAWAAVDSVAASGNDGPTARANLALLLGDAGRDDLALEIWGRVHWPERRGIGDGTVRYQAGRILERRAREREAVEAFRQAAESRATTFTDDGPPIAPAARDHLVDLGVSGAD